ncbi:caspase-1-like [Podarcis muralis]
MADEKLEKIRADFVTSANESLISQLLDRLLQKKVLNEEEADEVKCKEKKQDQARILIDHVRRKGHKASQIFIQALQCQDSFLFEKLMLKVPPSGQQAHLPRQEVGPRAAASAKAAQLQETSDGLTLCPLDLFQKIQAEEKDEIYPIKDKETRTRLALVICNIDFEHCSKREGAEVDLAQMKLLLEGLGYRVETETNLCSQDMATCLKSFAAQEEHKTSDSTFVVLMSHGLREGLCGVKHKDSCTDLLSVDTVFSTFNNKNCPALRGKPKVIVIQACRGVNKGFAFVSDSATPSAAPLSPVQWQEEDFESDAIHKVHMEIDFICLYSTTLGNVSWRSPRDGSLFITQLIKDFKEHAWNCNLEEIFRKVMKFFENKPYQMPSKDRTTLTKKFYLFPGH